MENNNVFEQLAKKYDTEDRKKLAKVIAEEVKLELQNSKSKSLIDYGSGTGLVSLDLTDLVDSVLLVDSSKQMLNIAESKISKLGITNAKLLYLFRLYARDATTESRYYFNVTSPASYPRYRKDPATIIPHFK